MRKYYYKSDDQNTIKMIGITSTENLPSIYTEISKEDYIRYKALVDSVEKREGFQEVITLYIDFTIKVGYEPIVYEGELESEEEGTYA